MTATELAERLGARRSGNGWQARCPAHDDRRASLCITEGDDGRVLLHCHAGCETEAVVKALGLSWGDLFPDKGWREAPWARGGGRGKIIATYNYTDAEGRLLFQVVRMHPKDFRQRRPCPHGGDCDERDDRGERKCRRDPDGSWWHWNLDGVQRVLYRLPAVLKAARAGRTVYIVEGEKDADNLAAIEVCATTCPQGAGKWRDEYGGALRGARVVILPDNDETGRRHAQEVAQSLYGVAASVRVLELPGLPPKGDVSDWLAAGGAREDLERMAAEAPEWKPSADADPTGDSASPSPHAEHPYKATRSGTMREKMTRDGPVLVPLANFTASIVAEEVRDDGAERRVVFTIAGRIGDEDLPTVAVPAERFLTVKWVTEAWGNRAIVYAGQGNQDHMRAAIQLLSGNVPRRTVYEHLGWRKIDGAWLYLHAGGAIGAGGAVGGISVEPDEALRHAVLPTPPDGEALAEAVRASLGLLDVAPRRLTVPLLAAVYRAPLAELLPADFSLFYAGPTGAQKSSVTALAQAHFGAAFDDRHLPAGWEATGNALERLAFIAKDAVLVIDDFAPKGTTADVQRMHRDADRVLRAQGNRLGRLRMRPDGTLRPVYTPRGLIVSSGEDVPAGQSLCARLLILEVAPGDVDLEALSRAQRDAASGLFGASMAGYVRWLAGRLDGLREALPARKRELRDEARREGWPHDRTPDLLANLALGWEQFLAFAADIGAISAAERERLWAEGWAAMAEAAREQAGHQANEEPTARFLALLGAAIASGRAHVADAETGAEPGDGERWGWRLRTIGTGDNEREEWQPQGERVGWLDGEHLLLEPDAAFAVVQRLARDQGTSLPLTQHTLWKRLREKGLLASREPGRNTTHWSIRSHPQKRPRVIHILADVLSPKTGTTGTHGTDPSNDTGLRPGFASRFLGNGEKVGHKSGTKSLLDQAPVPVVPVVPFLRDNTPPGFSRDGDTAEEAAAGEEDWSEWSA